MTEDRFDVTLRLLERAERPDPAFAEALYSQLAAQAGFGGARGGLRRVGARWPTFVAQLRPAWLVLLVGLLMLLVTGFALLGGGGQPVGLLGSRTEAPSQRPEPSESPFRLGSDVLKVGEVAPAWSGSLLDGTPFSTGDLLGQPAALFLWCSCAPGPYASRFLDEAASRSGEMALVLVSLDELGTTQGLVDWLGVRTPVAYDDDATGGLLRTWRLNGFPALVLLRPDGSVADIRSGVFSAGGLAAALDALAAGAPIPSPEPLPTPRSEAVSSVLVEGEPAPVLRGPLLGGGDLSTSDLLGKPTVVLHWFPPDAEGNPVDDAPGAETLLAEAAARAGSLNVLLIADGERTPGAVAAFVDRQGTDVPVIFDWDGQLHERWGLVWWPTLVLLDADGRVVAIYRQEGLIEPGPILDALIAGEPMPSLDVEWPPQG